MAFTATDCTADQINYRVCIAINYRDQLHLVSAGEAKVLKPRRRRWLNQVARRRRCRRIAKVVGELGKAITT